MGNENKKQYSNEELPYILIIGDLHFKDSNVKQIDQLYRRVFSLLKTKEVKHVIILGDVLHTHDRISLTALNKFQEFCQMMLEYVNVTILVGNHDMINNKVFCDNTGHWMNVMKNWKGLNIVDRPVILDICGSKICCVPYVEAGRFDEAIKFANVDVNSCDLVVAHQEFAGSKLSEFTNSTVKEAYNYKPMCISGHLHNYHVVNNPGYGSVLYAGSAFEHTYGQKKCWLWKVNKTGFMKIENGVDSLKQITITIDQQVEKVDAMTQIVVVVKSVEEFRQWERSDNARNAIKCGASIKMKNIGNETNNAANAANADTSCSSSNVINETIIDEIIKNVANDDLSSVEIVKQLMLQKAPTYDELFKRVFELEKELNITRLAEQANVKEILNNKNQIDKLEKKLKDMNHTCTTDQLKYDLKKFEKRIRDIEFQIM